MTDCSILVFPFPECGRVCDAKFKSAQCYVCGGMEGRLPDMQALVAYGVRTLRRIRSIMRGSATSAPTGSHESRP